MTWRSRTLAGALLLALPGLAAGHALNPGLLEIAERGAGHYTVLWKPPGFVSGDAVSVRSLGGLRPVFSAPCLVREPRSSREPAVAASDSRVAVLDLDCGGAQLRGISFAGGAGLPAEVLVRWSAADGSERTDLLRGADAGLVLPDRAPRSALGKIPRFGTISRYAALGLTHIAAGLDHLLFVACLLLLAGRLRHLISSVTAFTAAHTLTLALATTGQVRLPTQPVEILIALSVVLAAAEAARGPNGRPGAPNRAWVMAFAFGLLHGFGFAGALADIGLPPQRVPSALLGFNLGVEAGQLVFVSLLWWPLRAGLALASKLPPWTALLPAYAIGCVAAVWTAERVAAAL